MTGQQTLKHHLMHLGGRGAVQKPANERDPYASSKIAPEHAPDADDDEEETKEAPHVRGQECGASHVARNGPHDGTEDATTVERVTGNQIKQHQSQVDVGQILGQPPQWLTVDNHRLHRVEKDCQGKTYEGARDRDEELCDGTGWFSPNLSDPTEEEQRDAAHRNVVPQRYHGMPQFMEQYAHKEHDGRHRAHEPVQQRRPVLKLVWIVIARQHPGEQREDQEPGIIQTNRDSHDPA